MSGQRVPGKVFAALASVAHTIIVTSASYKGQEPAHVREEIQAVVGDTPVLLAIEPARPCTRRGPFSAPAKSSFSPAAPT